MEESDLKSRLKDKLQMPKGLEREISEAFEPIRQKAEKIKKL